MYIVQIHLEWSLLHYSIKSKPALTIWIPSSALGNIGPMSKCRMDNMIMIFKHEIYWKIGNKLHIDQKFWLHAPVYIYLLPNRIQRIDKATTSHNNMFIKSNLAWVTVQYYFFKKLKNVSIAFNITSIKLL